MKAAPARIALYRPCRMARGYCYAKCKAIQQAVDMWDDLARPCGRAAPEKTTTPPPCLARKQHARVSEPCCTHLLEHSGLKLVHRRPLSILAARGLQQAGVPAHQLARGGAPQRKRALHIRAGHQDVIIQRQNGPASRDAMDKGAPGGPWDRYDRPVAAHSHLPACISSHSPLSASPCAMPTDPT